VRMPSCGSRFPQIRQVRVDVLNLSAVSVSMLALHPRYHDRQGHCNHVALAT
jgi:hypothetical protein